MGKHVRVFYLSIWREVVRPLTVFPIQITVLFTCISGFKLFVTRSGFGPLSSDTELQIPLQRFRWHVISLRDLFDGLWHVAFMWGRWECWSFMHQRHFSLLALHSLSVPQDVITRCPQQTTWTQWVIYDGDDVANERSRSLRRANEQRARVYSVYWARSELASDNLKKTSTPMIVNEPSLIIEDFPLLFRVSSEPTDHWLDRGKSQ